MNRKKLIKEIKKNLLAKRDLEYKKGSIRYFKEPINPIGVRAGDTRRIATKQYSQVKDLPKKELFEVCEDLLKTGYFEYGIIAFEWAKRRIDEYQKGDFATFERWLSKYVKNWAHCDDFCTHALGALLFKFPELLNESKKWTKSKNRWEKRAAAVTLIYHAKRKEKKFLKGIFLIADELFLDEDDLVQKGYGWMLKVAADVWQKEVFEYVLKHKNKMPRTALRYAIEKMPGDLKKQAMLK